MLGSVMLLMMIMEPITSEKALAIARAKIAEIKSEHQYVLLEKRTQEHDFGWVFFYTTRKHAETGNPKFSVPGNGPLVVERETGHSEFLPTSVPPATAIESYKERMREREEKEAGAKKTKEEPPE